MNTKGRTFAYCRVSTIEQTVENQILAIQAAGYDIPAHRIISETVSGSVSAASRPEFSLLTEYKIEKGDILVVLKMDRIGRDMIDVMQTLEVLSAKKVSVISLDLGQIDLTSPAGKLQVQVMAAVAEFERNRIRERTKEGLERAKAQGKKIGRPVATDTRVNVRELQAQGLTQEKASKALSVSLSTVRRHWLKNTNNIQATA